MSEDSESVRYLSAEDVLAMHELIVESNADTEPGVTSPGDVKYAVEAIQDAPFGQTPETLHEKAYQLLRLLAANHPFVDGNKRTALMSARIFYALNGVEFDYDRQVKSILKQLATDETTVEGETVTAYLRDHTDSLAPEYRATIELWLSRIDESGSLPGGFGRGRTDTENDEQNGYDDDTRRED
jgi:death-on-curing protein